MANLFTAFHFLICYKNYQYLKKRNKYKLQMHLSDNDMVVFALTVFKIFRGLNQVKNRPSPPPPSIFPYIPNLLGSTLLSRFNL